MKYLTLCLDLAGVLLLVFFAYLLWAPLALLVGGTFALVASWSIQRKLRKPETRRLQ